MKKILIVIETIIVTVMVILALIMVGAKLMGGGTYTILSGSTEPTCHVGSLIIVQPVDHRELNNNY